MTSSYYDEAARISLGNSKPPQITRESPKTPEESGRRTFVKFAAWSVFLFGGLWMISHMQTSGNHANERQYGRHHYTRSVIPHQIRPGNRYRPEPFPREPRAAIPVPRTPKKKVRPFADLGRFCTPEEFMNCVRYFDI